MTFLRVPLIGLAFCSILSFGGCAYSLPSEQGRDLGKLSTLLYVKGVPFFPQKKYQCGPASLASILNYWGQEVSPDEIAQAIYLPHLKGSLTMDLWHFARAQGLDTQVEEGSLGYLKAQLQQKQPVIAFVNLGFRFFPVGHFLVVVGLDPHEHSVIAYSGTEKDKKIPYPKFLSSWEKTGYWSLVVTPKEKA
jgi:ABC-type bacteriocin/lantibiotic exporter with double-glycine peptidase domain